MSTPKGWPTQEKDQRLIPQFATVEPVHTLQHGLSVLAHQYVYEVATATAEAGSSTIAIIATASGAQAGDVIRLTSGALSGREIKVYEVSGTTITLAEELPSAVAAGVTFQILRHKYPLVEPTGEIKISGSFSTTEEATAADGAALPAKVKVAGGYDGSAVQVLKTDANGELQVDVLSSALPAGAATESSLTAIGAKLGTLGQKNMAGSAPVVIASDQSAIPISGSVSVSNNANGTPGVAIPSEATMVGGSDGTLLRALKTDVNGELQIDVLSSALPTGAASESRQVDGTQKTQIANGGTSASVLAISAGLNSVTSSGLVTMSELYALPLAGGNPVRVRTTDTVGRLNVDINSMPAGTATASNQTDGSQKTQLVDAGGDVAEIKALNVALVATDKGIITSSTIHGLSSAGGGTYVDVKVSPSGALNTEATLAGLDAAVLGQETMANSLPVVIASDQTAIPVTGSFTAGTLTVVDLLDAGILDTSSTNIPGSASSPVQVIATTAATIKALQLLDTTGAFVGVYVGGSGSEVLHLVMGPGSDQTIEHTIASGSRVSLKRLDSTTAISSGIVAINCLG
jgi:hypothetical protein